MRRRFCGRGSGNRYWCWLALAAGSLLICLLIMPLRILLLLAAIIIILLGIFMFNC